MTANKQDPLIPSEAKQEADLSATTPDEHAPLVPAAGTPTHPPEARKQPEAENPAGQPADLWSNGHWAVTELGLESREIVNGNLMYYPIEKERLLEVVPGTAVSARAKHVGEKSWVAPEPLLDAYDQALRIHHPGQTVINLNATREHVVREHSRIFDRKEDHPDGYEYTVGEPTLQRLKQRDAEAKATGDGGEPPEESWVSPIIGRIRDAFMKYGVDPSVHSAAVDVNERLAAMAMRGASDEELAAAADRLKSDLILHDEEPEKDIPPEAEEYIE